MDDQSGMGAAGLAGAKPVRLPRPGRRAFLFRGAEVASVTGYGADVSTWHEISLYETAGGAAVVDIRYHDKAADAEGYVVVQALPNLRTAVTFVEEHDPAEKILAAALRAGGAEAALAAARGALPDVLRRYRDLSLQIAQMPIGDEEFAG
jgi:hypothetical protein